MIHLLVEIQAETMAKCVGGQTRSKGTSEFQMAWGRDLEVGQNDSGKVGALF